MELQDQLSILKQELSIPKDRFQSIIYSIATNFIKKYQHKVDRNPKQVLKDLRTAVQQLDVYSEYALSLLHKYDMLQKLECIVRGVIQNQSSLLTYIIEDMINCLESNSQMNSQICQMTKKVYEKCVNCEKNMQKSRIDNLQAQISMKFTDLYSYFAHDIEQINKLEEEARLILHKKNLGLQGISEEVYIQKLIKMKDNMDNTIYYVTSSLDNIVSFQHKLSEIQEIQNFDSNTNSLFINKFNAKNYMIKLSSHFQRQITTLSDKLDRIKKYFIEIRSQQVQTQLSVDDLSISKFQQLKKQYLEQQILSKQAEIQKNSLETKLKDSQQTCDLLQNKIFVYEKQMDKMAVQVKQMEADLQFYRKKEESLKPDYKQSTKQIIENFMLNKKKQEAAKNNASLSGNIDELSNEDEQEVKQLKDSTKIDKQNEDLLSISLRNKASSIISKKKHSQSKKNLLNRRDSISTGLQKTYIKKIIQTKSSFDNQDIKETVQEQDNTNLGSMLGMSSKKGNSYYSSQGQNSKSKNLIDIKKQDKKEKHRVSQEVSMAISLPQQNKTKMPRISRKEESKYRKSLKLSYDQGQDYIGKLYLKHQEKMRANKQNILKFSEFKEKVESFIDEIIVQEKPHKDISMLLKTKIAHSINQNSSSIQMKTSQKDDHKLVEIVSKKTNEKMLQKESEKKSSLPGTLRNKKIKKNLNLEDISLKNPVLVESQAKDKRYSEDESTLIKYTKLGTNNEKLGPRGRYSEVIDNEYLKNRDKMSKTSGFMEAIRSQNVDSLIFTKQDEKILFLTEAIRQFNLKHSFSKNQKFLNYQKVCDILQPNQIRFMKQFFTRLANIHLRSQQFYDQIRFFLTKPFSDSTNLNLPGVTRTSFHKQDESIYLKQSFNHLLIFHRNCTVKGELCKHLSYFMRKIIKIQEASV